MVDPLHSNRFVHVRENVIFRMHRYIYAYYCIVTYFYPTRTAIMTFYNPQIEMFARFKMKSSFHKTKRII